MSEPCQKKKARCFSSNKPQVNDKKRAFRSADREEVRSVQTDLKDEESFRRRVGAVCGTGAPQGPVLSPFLFSLNTSDFRYSSDHCHIQRFYDDTAIVECVSDGKDQEYGRGRAISDFDGWCRPTLSESKPFLHLLHPSSL